MKKSAVISALNEFPKEFNLEDFLERLIVIEKIDDGLKDLKEGKTVSHSAVKKMIKKWRK
jgi:predicted transcriptional regulator